jgi:tetratricopeptide (TPR) repeat protein
MKLITIISFLSILMIGMATGCSGVGKTQLLFEEKEMFAISYHYRQRANEAETVSDWYMAKYLYQIAYQLDPENLDIPVKIVSLENRIKTESQIYFQQGLDFYQIGEIKKARQALMTALRINPEHQKARIYLLEIVQQPEENTFTVNQKTDLETIAQEFYNDPEKSFLIAYFNDIKDQATPEIGSTLIIPWVPIQKTVISSDLEENIEKARLYLDTKRFSQALAMTSKIREQEPENVEATEIENAVYHQTAQEFERFGKYTQALNTMLKVKSDNESTKSYISHLSLMVKDKADIHYRRGVRYFVNEELEKAIKEWEQTLAIDPTNEMAQKDIGNAKSLLEKLRQIQ